MDRGPGLGVVVLVRERLVRADRGAGGRDIRVRGGGAQEDDGRRGGEGETGGEAVGEVHVDSFVREGFSSSGPVCSGVELRMPPAAVDLYPPTSPSTG